MLRFQEPLTPAAKYLVAYSLEVADDELHDFDSDEWVHVFSRSASCFSLDLARTTIADLRDKLERPELYQLTDYHWLLLYDVLEQGIVPLSDWQIPEVNRDLASLASPEDGYLEIRRRGRRKPHVQIDFGWFIDKFFWDTDFFLSRTVYEQLDPEAKQQLGVKPETFGVIQGMAPHRDELRLEVWTEENEGTS
jgi:hypothetical protein